MSLFLRSLSAAALVAAAACASCPRPAPAKFAMRSYYLVILERGPAWSPDDTPENRKLGEAHMANIRAMGASGKLVLAGPFEADAADRDAAAGLFLFDVPTLDEARALAEGDPAVQAGRFTVKVLTWYGPAGLTYPGKEGP
jgi:uncharacterized protein YciI